MKFALVIFETPEQLNRRNGPEAPAYWASWIAYGEAMGAAGVMAGGAGLQPPSTATSVRLSSPKHTIQDGPFIDSKEQLGGFYLIDVPDLDAALKWASRAPTPGGVVEVRPLLVM